LGGWRRSEKGRYALVHKKYRNINFLKKIPSELLQSRPIY
jgi:hypothetical protein